MEFLTTSSAVEQHFYKWVHVLLEAPARTQEDCKLASMDVTMQHLIW